MLAVSYQRLLYGYRKDRLPWYYERGLTDQSITSFGLGHDGTRFCIPVYDDHYNLVTFRYRADPAFEIKADEGEEVKKPPKYSGVYQRNDVRLYPEWLIANSGEDFLVVCEGELDAARVWQEGIPAGTPINGAGNLVNIVKLLKPYPHIKKLYIASDMDDAGEKGARELMEEAHRAGYTAVRLTWPRSMGKDITELLEWQGTEYEYELFRDIKHSRNRAA
jgi:5S rRNA maturation endonuclease (ribonuclease M5)